MRSADPDPVSGESPVEGGFSRLPRLLREWRIHHALKSAGVAARLGVSPATWGHWETGKRFPSWGNLVLISRLTGIPMQHFFCPCADVCPVSISKLEPKSTEPKGCGRCGAPLYQE